MAKTSEGDGEKKSILIAGPPYRAYLGAVAAGFKEHGVEPRLLLWEYPRRSFWEEIMFYSSEAFRTRLAESQDKRNSESLEDAIMRTEPGSVLVMKAVEITPKVKRYCEDRGIKLALWAYDSASEFPIISRVAPSYDLVYTYEPADLELLSSSCEPKFLPMAYDPRDYFPTSEGKAKEVDLSFVGAIDSYPQRRELIRKVADRQRDAEIWVWTDSIHWYSHKRARDFAFKGSRKNLHLVHKTQGHSEINKVHNSSRICLNIHHAQSKMAKNPRSFEILGSGGLLLTDRGLEDIKGFEDGRGYVAYSSTEELLEKVGELLQDDALRGEIAAEGHSKVAPHTYAERAKTILSDLS